MTQCLSKIPHQVPFARTVNREGRVCSLFLYFKQFRVAFPIPSRPFPVAIRGPRAPSPIGWGGEAPGRLPQDLPRGAQDVRTRPHPGRDSPFKLPLQPGVCLPSRPRGSKISPFLASTPLNKTGSERSGGVVHTRSRPPLHLSTHKEETMFWVTNLSI